jgi:hypothetical protein
MSSANDPDLYLSNNGPSPVSSNQNVDCKTKDRPEHFDADLNGSAIPKNDSEDQVHQNGSLNPNEVASSEKSHLTETFRQLKICFSLVKHFSSLDLGMAAALTIYK